MKYLIKRYNENTEHNKIRVVADEDGYMVQIYVSVLGEMYALTHNQI